ncbi:Glycosyltransferase family 10 (fucosyltransferase) [compost metagenome]
MNNIGGPVANKLDFLSSYKFNLCFENYSFPFYTTEKIVDAMRCRSVPLYWGSPVIGSEFNDKAIISAHSFSSDEELIEHIIRVDQSDELYLKYLSEPYYRDNIPSQLYEKDYLAKFIQQILVRENLPIVHSLPLFEKIYSKTKRRIYRRYSYQYDWRV